MSHLTHAPEMCSGDRQRKYTSPPPPPSNMTPPPSTSHPQPPYPARTPTPTHSHLSSPPPTIKTAAARHRTANLLDAESLSQSSDNEGVHDISQLRAMLAKAEGECKAAKTSAAHYRFQLELENFESSESMKRMEVELQMTAREVEVLQHAQDQSPMAVSEAEFLSWKNRCIMLEAENAELRMHVAHAKALIVESEDRNVEKTGQLKKRIRDNRMRMNTLRNSGALFGETHSYNTPARIGNAYTSPDKARSDDPFGNLLLADQVLRNQEAASTPSTPMGSRQRGHAHVRSQQSLASLPSTPYRSAPRSYPAYYSKPLERSPVQHQAPSSQREAGRQRSRDSTISASEGEDNAELIPDSEDETEYEGVDDVAVGTSRASQEASNMLRKSSSFRQSQTHNRHFQSPPSRGTANVAARPISGGQMYGYQITKPGAPGQAESIKRRFYDGGPGEGESGAKQPKKRGRTSRYALEGENAGLGLGLGLGGWGGSK